MSGSVPAGGLAPCFAQGTHGPADNIQTEFNIFEVLKIGELLEAGAYGDLDTETAREMLAEVARLAEGPIAATFAKLVDDSILDAQCDKMAVRQL